MDCLTPLCTAVSDEHGHDCADEGRTLGNWLEDDREELLQEAVIGSAMLAVTAFRLRDEEGLTMTLRRLASAVVALERARAED